VKDTGIQAPTKVQHYAIKVVKSEKASMLSDCIKAYGGLKRKCIIFCDTKNEVNALFFNIAFLYMCIHFYFFFYFYVGVCVKNKTTKMPTIPWRYCAKES
jgi:hypothetical protein